MVGWNAAASPAGWSSSHVVSLVRDTRDPQLGFFSVFLQVLRSLFGSRLASLISATPTSDDITEGSAGSPSSSSTGLTRGHGASTALVGRQKVAPQFFLDFLRRQSKIRRRSRNSMVGGRGCFGMKMDRIGSISGLGC